jgi:hypothetical protein
MLFGMRKSGDRPPLTLVDPGLSPVQPPRPLGTFGRALWDRVQREYDVSDPAGIEFLCLAGEALDRAESLRERIEADGVCVRTAGAIKAHRKPTRIWPRLTTREAPRRDGTNWLAHSQRATEDLRWRTKSCKQSTRAPAKTWPDYLALSK